MCKFDNIYTKVLADCLKHFNDWVHSIGFHSFKSQSKKKFHNSRHIVKSKQSLILPLYVAEKSKDNIRYIDSFKIVNALIIFSNDNADFFLLKNSQD